MTQTVAQGGDPEPVRKVGFLLGIGILLMPYIFAWFLLRRGYSTLARVVSFAWMTFVIIVAASGANTNSPKTTPTAQTPVQSSSTSAPPSAVATESAASSSSEPTSNWSYSENTDEMRGATTYYADVTSENELNFDFPYNGGSTGTLTIRKSPIYGTDVILRISSGQFVCNSYSGDHVSVKFDTGPIQRFSCNEPADGAVGVLFIENSPRFIAALKKAKRVVVEAQYYQEGNQQLIFNTTGFVWKH